MQIIAADQKPGRLKHKGRYLLTELDREEERERRRKQRAADRQLERWARLFKAHKTINGSNEHETLHA